MKKTCTICWLFDSGKIDGMFYGEEVFSQIFAQKSLFENKEKMFFSTGDIIDENIASDCSQIAIRDEMCTIENLPEGSKDWPFAVVVEGIEEEIAHKIDRGICDYEAYYGMTRVDLNPTDVRRLFWKNLIRSFSLMRTKITVHGFEEDGFIYRGIAEESGLEVSFDEDFDSHMIGNSSICSDGEQLKTSKLKPNSIRGRREMNFALVKEVEIAGTQIWRSIKDLDRVNIEKDRHVGENNIGYLFLAFYQAAQGIERLQKILIELITKITPSKENELEKLDDLLRSHNHNALNKYIEERKNIRMHKSETRFLETLRRFYSEARYGRFSFSKENERETTLIHELGRSIPEERYDVSVKNQFGRALANLSKIYYDLIRELSHDINIYVYEINTYSDASYVFYNADGKSLYQLYKEIEQSKKELLYFLMLKGKELISNTIAENYHSLDFDKADVPDYMMALISDCDSASDLYDYVDCEYDEMAEGDKEAWKERFEVIQNIDKIVRASLEVNL